LLIAENRLGIEGNWSTTSFFVGGMDAADSKLQLLISTALSETWAISEGGCLERRFSSETGLLMPMKAEPLTNSVQRSNFARRRAEARSTAAHLRRGSH